MLKDWPAVEVCRVFPPIAKGSSRDAKHEATRRAKRAFMGCITGGSSPQSAPDQAILTGKLLKAWAWVSGPGSYRPCAGARPRQPNPGPSNSGPSNSGPSNSGPSNSGQALWPKQSWLKQLWQSNCGSSKPWLT